MLISLCEAVSVTTLLHKPIHWSRFFIVRSSVTFPGLRNRGCYDNMADNRNCGWTVIVWTHRMLLRTGSVQSWEVEWDKNLKVWSIIDQRFSSAAQSVSGLAEVWFSWAPCSGSPGRLMWSGSELLQGLVWSSPGSCQSKSGWTKEDGNKPLWSGSSSI